YAIAGDEERHSLGRPGPRYQDGRTILVAATLPPHPESEASDASGGVRFQRLGEILIERGKIQQEDLDRALELQLERGDKIGKIMVDMGLIAQRDMLSALSDQLGVPVIAIEGMAPPDAHEVEGLSHRVLGQRRSS